MEILSTPIAGLKIIQLKVHHDNRGFFVERFNQKFFKEFDLPINYFQDNHSYSLPSVVRGLHYQNNPSQAKLVGCLRGKILDVAVDIRHQSPTFGKYFSIELSPQNGKLLFIPAGFAHGFSVLGDESADVMYKVDNAFSKEGDGGIRFDDADLNIDWQVKSPIVSDKDQNLQSFKNYSQKPIF
ncbi:MAG: dTDP-4-dehydrorhamnose 3,5-epimerase [Proteobacteria bacterium]|nr:dTDP-4-dehydrorhamnose 3,5-epimerase [Pseudomonadota bacterium]NCA28781.1 dTDP-4-dehydrorhamnose 3,5-epimerase [Pseudomonadota bacterium]